MKYTKEEKISKSTPPKNWKPRKFKSLMEAAIFMLDEEELDLDTMKTIWVGTAEDGEQATLEEGE